MSMMVAEAGSRTDIHEIADGIYRISTAISLGTAGNRFSFNRYLILDEEPLLFHTGPRRLFPFLRQGIEEVMPVERLRYIGFSHVEADECGALNDLLAIAPLGVPLCSSVAALTSTRDIADREPKVMADGEVLSLGRHSVQWFDAPHVPHGWDCGYLFDITTATLFCGDLFTQPGNGDPPVTSDDILEASEAFRLPLDYYAHAPQTRLVLERLAGAAPRVLACMHGSAWRGDGGTLLLALADRLEQSRPAQQTQSPRVESDRPH